MSSYTLFGKEVSFSKAADRYFYILKAFETCVDAASKEFHNFYYNSGNISSVLDNYMNVVYLLSNNWGVDPLFSSLVNAEIYDVSRERFEEACWDLSKAEPYYDAVADKYNEIVGELDAAREYRAMRKASRNRFGWISSTDMDNMAITAMTAGTLNAITGIGHTIKNTIGNIGSSISATSSKKALYDNPKTLELLDAGLRECIQEIYLLFMSFVNEYKRAEGKDVWYDGSPYDSEKADTLLKNSREVAGKEQELLLRAFSVCPYHYEVCASIFIRYEEERKNIFEIAQKYKNDLTPLVEAVLGSLYSETDTTSEQSVRNTKEKIRATMSEYNIEDSDTLDELETNWLAHILTNTLEYSAETLEQFRKYDALEKNKKSVIKKLKVWQLSKEYGVEFDHEEAEEIFSSIWTSMPNKSEDVCNAAKRKIKFVLNNILIKNGYSLEKSKTFCKIEDYQLGLICSGYKSFEDIESCENLIQRIEATDALERNKNIFIKRVKEKQGILEAEKKERDACTRIYQTQMQKMFATELDDFSKRVKSSTLNKETKQKYLTAIEQQKTKVTSLQSALTDFLLAFCNGLINKHSLSDKFLVSGTPKFSKKFPNADEAYGGMYEIAYSGAYVDEIELILYDDTIFGNAKNGFILTNKRLFAKSLSAGRIVCSLENIVEIKAEKNTVLLLRGSGAYQLLSVGTEAEAIMQANLLSEIITIAKDTTFENIEDRIQQEKNNTKKHKEVKTASPPASVQSVFPTTATTQSTKTPVIKCTKCGARYPSDMASCPTCSNQSTDNILVNKDGYVNKESLAQQIATLLKKYDCGTARTCALAGTAAFSKKIGKAIESYAALEKDETALLLRDTTFFGSGKEGFLLTDKALYVCSLGKSGRFPLNSDFSFEANYSMKLYHINFLPYNDLSVATTFTESESKVEISLWKELIALLKSVDTVPSTSIASTQNNSSWTCACGSKNTGKFCSDCGKKKEEALIWTCGCGATNSGKFCQECGSPKKV